LLSDLILHGLFIKLKISISMIFELSEQHLAVREAARDFARKECLPGVIERDSKMIHPTEILKKMGEMGFLGMMVDEKYGGGGMDTLSYAIAMEEFSKIDNSCSVAMSVNNSLSLLGAGNLRF
jgi:alkylation response protein AidB-like acyl-CoA dehydrogenase